MTLLCQTVVLLCLATSLAEAITAYVDPELILRELGDGDVNCTASGAVGRVEYRWTKPDDPDWPFVYTQVLEFSQVTIDQAGVYVCEVRDVDNGATASDAMELIIHYDPRWNDDYVKKSAAYEGTATNIKCVVLSLPTADFYWMRDGHNITSSSEYIITSLGNTSTLHITNVKNTDYGTFDCSANNYIGGRNFSIQFTRPGIPDSPRECHSINVTDHSATLECVKGYDGGEFTTFKFTVFKRQPWSEPSETENEYVWKNDDTAEIIVHGLDSNTSYTLLIYQENRYGRSDTAYGVLVTTEDGPPLPVKGIDPEMAAIIGGAVGGAVLVLAIFLIVCLSCRQNKNKKQKSTPQPNLDKHHAAKKKDVKSYVMEDDVAAGNSSKDNTRSPLRDIRNSFRMRRQPAALATGINNPNYVPDENTGKVVLDFSQELGSPEHENKAYYIKLNHKPGESSSDAVYENTAYLRDSESNLNTSSVSSDAVIHRQMMTNPVLRAQRQSLEQPGLAGFGALHDLNPIGLINGQSVPPPMTPNIGKQVRLSLRPPSFEPEVPWEFPRERLFIRLKIGEGTFGEVWRAKAEGILGRPGRVAVAVKMLKSHYTPEERRSLIKELEIMKLLQPHPNVIQLLGCCTQSEPFCIIMEYAVNGNLQDLLRCQRSAYNINDLSQDSPESNRKRNVNLQFKDLKRFGLHVASGMEYIASRELLHRDLAARNVLVDENMVCKVGDFGSARDIIQMRQYESKTQRRLPIRWMAPESLLQCVYSQQSDVWSFGILLWEIITLGSSPYPGMGGPEVIKFIEKGCRMSKPKHCSDALYAVMKDCWNQFPPKRPSFNILRHRMIAILDEPGDEIYVDQMCDNAYDILDNLPGEIIF